MKLYIDECAIDLVPKDWRRNKDIEQYFSRYKRYPLINGSRHQHLLSNIPKKDRKDRPDILHFGLLLLLGYAELVENIEIYFNCAYGSFKVDSKTRLPRDQNRFYGLLENIFQNEKSNQFIFPTELALNTEKTIIFSREGKSVDEINLIEFDTFIFGGFAYGNLKEKYPNYQVVSLSDKSLDLWTAISLFFNEIK